MPNISPHLRAKLENAPDATVRLIIQVKGEPGKRALDFESRGVMVRHVYSLTPSLAVEGFASAILKFVDETWIASIEEDKAVHTM